MIKVAAITSGRNLPSTRFRIRQHIQPLGLRGVAVKEYCPVIDKWASVPGKPEKWSNRKILPLYGVWQGVKLCTRLPGLMKSHTTDVTWLNKELLPGYSTLESWLAKPLVTDIDDAIWLTPPFGERVSRKLAQRSDCVIAGNDYLAEWFDRHNKNIEIIPTAIDTNLVSPRSVKIGSSDIFTVGWMGSKGNLVYLESIGNELTDFFKECKDARLLVVSDQKPEFKFLNAEQVVFKFWSPAEEVRDLSKMDVGLMPLEDSEWARGKCAFKMLQYMAMEKPVVVSSVGMNAQVLKEAEIGFGVERSKHWVDALIRLYRDREMGRRLGIRGRQLVVEKYSVEVVSRQLAKVFHGFA